MLRVDAIDRQPARTLEQVQGEIATTLAAEQKRAALDDLTARVEEEFEAGRSLSVVAEELDIELVRTRPATADGRIYGSTGETVAPILGRVLEVAFQMEEGEPQLTALADGQTFLAFDVADLTPSATAPLAENRDDVTAAWRRDEGAKAARAAADRILARVARGGTLAAAVAAEQKPIPAPRQIDLNREQLAAQGRVPSELALFFSMAEGTTKKLEGPADAGWYVVRLDDIETPEADASDPLVLATLRQLSQVSSGEYLEQFVNAAKGEVGVERNEAAINAVAAQLTGQTNQ